MNAARTTLLAERVEDLFELVAPVEEPRLHGADRATNDAGDLLDGVSFQVVEPHDYPLFVRHPAEGSINHRPQFFDGSIFERIGVTAQLGRKLPRRLLLDVDQLDVLPLAEHTQADVDRDAADPGRDLAVPPEARQAPVDVQQRLLERVLRR